MQSGGEKTILRISAYIPTQRYYFFGEYFDPTGIIVTVHYSDGTSDTVQFSDYAGIKWWLPNNPNDPNPTMSNSSYRAFIAGDKNIVITYSVDGKTYETVSTVGVGSRPDDGNPNVIMP